jgi:hypothetical protein
VLRNVKKILLQLHGADSVATLREPSLQIENPIKVSRRLPEKSQLPRRGIVKATADGAFMGANLPSQKLLRWSR